ncbi:MAG TPA: flavodoxin family protein [Myxococcales bacterium]
MRILAINGSHRGHRGHTGFLIDRVFAGAREAGAECEEVTLAQLRVQRCLACDRCQKREPRFECVLDDKDDVRAVFRKLAAADLVVWATPVYVFGISSLLRTFLERFYCTGDANRFRATKAGLFFHEVDPAVCSKPFVSLICCDNIEEDAVRNARDFFPVFSRFLDAPQVGELVRNGGMVCRHGAPGDRAAAVAASYAAFEQAGRELATDGRLTRATMRRARQEVIPIPLFGLFKRLRLVGLKRRLAQRAQAMRG